MRGSGSKGMNWESTRMHGLEQRTSDEDGANGVYLYLLSEVICIELVNVCSHGIYLQMFLPLEGNSLF